MTRHDAYDRLTGPGPDGGGTDQGYPLGHRASTAGAQRLLEAGDDVSLRSDELFNRIAAELERLSNHLIAVEQVMPLLLMNRSAPPPTPALAALQQLDLVAQTVVSLTGFLRTINAARPLDRVLIGAGLRSLTLSDLAARLGAMPQAASGWPLDAGDALSVTSPQTPVNMGEVELF